MCGCERPCFMLCKIALTASLVRDAQNGRFTQWIATDNGVCTVQHDMCAGPGCLQGNNGASHVFERKKALTLLLIMLVLSLW